MIMKLQSDREFYEILPQFDVVTCDSQILFMAAKLLGTPSGSGCLVRTSFPAIT